MRIICNVYLFEHLCWQAQKGRHTIPLVLHLHFLHNAFLQLAQTWITWRMSMSSSNVCHFGTSLPSTLVQPQFVGSCDGTLLFPSRHSHPACRHARRVCSKSPLLEGGRQRRFASASRMKCSCRSESNFAVFL